MEFFMMFYYFALYGIILLDLYKKLQFDLHDISMLWI